MLGVTGPVYRLKRRTARAVGGGAGGAGGGGGGGCAGGGGDECGDGWSRGLAWALRGGRWLSCEPWVPMRTRIPSLPHQRHLFGGDGKNIRAGNGDHALSEDIEASRNARSEDKCTIEMKGFEKGDSAEGRFYAERKTTKHENSPQNCKNNESFICDNKSLKQCEGEILGKKKESLTSENNLNAAEDYKWLKTNKNVKGRRAQPESQAPVFLGLVSPRDPHHQLRPLSFALSLAADGLFTLYDERILFKRRMSANIQETIFEEDEEEEEWV